MTTKHDLKVARARLTRTRNDMKRFCPKEPNEPTKAFWKREIDSAESYVELLEEMLRREKA